MGGMRMETTLFDQAAALVQRLSPREKIRPVGRIMAALEEDIPPEAKKPRRSQYGALSDPGLDISSEDIDEARQAMLANFPREDIGQ